MAIRWSVAWHLLLVLSGPAAAAGADLITGHISDARFGEPLAGVTVRCDGTETLGTSNAAGAFSLPAELPCSLRVTGVGYRPVAVLLTRPGEVIIQLISDSLGTPRQSVTVSAGRFEGEETAVALSGNELRNLSTVLVDDPVRAVQSLPGVTANDDFQSQFSLRGAGFSRVGMLIDGVLLHSPFHSVQSESSSASVSSFQGEILESALLEAGPLASNYSDRTAGVLDLRSRIGLPTEELRRSRRLLGRMNLSTVTAAGSAEGRLGRRGTWLAAARQSYLQYIIQRTSDEAGLGFAFRDAQVKLSFDPSPAHRLNLLMMAGNSTLTRDTQRQNLGINTITGSSYNSGLVIATWRYTPSAAWLVTSRGAYLREEYGDRNRNSAGLHESSYREWVTGGSVSRNWNGRNVTEVGGSSRAVRDNGLQVRIQTAPLPVNPIQYWRGSGVRWGGYARHTGTSGNGRLRFESGLRGDGQTANNRTVVLPYAAAAWSGPAGWRFTLGWSAAAQFPELAQLTSTLGRRALPPARSQQTEFTAARQVGGSVRLRLNVFDRADRDLTVRPLYDPRRLAVGFYGGSNTARWEASQRGYARGVQVLLQRRSANRLNGWVAYSFTRSRMRDGILRLHFDSDFEARHLWQVASLYRLGARWNLTGRFSYGTGTPVPGFYAPSSTTSSFLVAQRNLLRLPNYQRTDLRLNRLFLVRHRQWTLFAELLNVTNHRNVRYEEVRSVDTRTGAVRLAINRTFPIVPSVGLVIDF